MNPKRAVLIAGPTASGKSALALAVAERIGHAVIVNADSMQVYADLRVLTARPDAAEVARVRHALFGTVDGADAYSVARYVEDVSQVIAAARTQGLLPIIVGGTGLYFKALLEGLSPVPGIEPALRKHLRDQAAAFGAARMHEILAAKDPEMAARLKPGDTQRITRALEVIEATGKSLADWQRLPGVPVLAADATARFVLSPSRETLMRRCDARFKLMIEAGALDEVAALGARGLSPDLPVMRALGVRPLSAYRAGEISIEEASTQAMAETRQFAKRQVTWLKRYMIAWKWLTAQETKGNTTEIISNIDL
ncbi:MAG: tRNA (adenosine(37)-N6)-dimethylallyltransferase MiaA [Hyphomicrobiaceae bacterium]